MWVFAVCLGVTILANIRRKVKFLCTYDCVLTDGQDQTEDSSGVLLVLLKCSPVGKAQQLGLQICAPYLFDHTIRQAGACPRFGCSQFSNIRNKVVFRAWFWHMYLHLRVAKVQPPSKCDTKSGFGCLQCSPSFPIS